MPKLRIGCSGFAYDSWRHVFYPEDMPQQQWFNFYVGRFSTVELNVTFYRLPQKETFMKWCKDSPENFAFSIKGSRFITHIKKLKDIQEPIDAFFSRATALGEKLEVVLWQLPPAFKADAGRLKEFLELIRPYSVRNTFEFRNEGWLNKKILSILEKENAAVCMADWPGFLDDLPVTADFVYSRRHGEAGNYASSYSTEALKKDAKRIKAYMRQGKDVYMYFNNDAFGYAPKNASELRELLKDLRPSRKKQ